MGWREKSYLGIILRVEHPVSVVPIDITFTIPIVRACDGCGRKGHARVCLGRLLTLCRAVLRGESDWPLEQWACPRNVCVDG